MKNRLLIVTLVILSASLSILLFRNLNEKGKESVAEPSFEPEKQAAYHYARWKYEADLVKDPTTGQPLFGLRDQEIEFAKTIPERGSSNSNSRTGAQNTYLPAGPNNIGGRTRALAYDVRYNGTSNRIIIAGSVSGGIYRSSDGGANWTRVSPLNEMHNVSNVAQDPRPGNQDTWYAGGGEYIGSSTDAPGAGYLSHGIFKSIDNGVTWTRLPLNTITDIGGGTLPSGVAERFDHPFDYIHKLAINPVNGHLYVAGHRRLMRSSDGGNTFQVVFGSGIAAFALNGQIDVTCSPTGKIYVAASGSFPDFSLRGIWMSPTGNANSWTRLAGGSTLGVDSVANWRGNSYQYQDVGGSNFYDPKRVLIALAPSNENILYVLYENGLSNSSPDFSPECDLFKLDMTLGNNWSNRSANVPNWPGGNHEATDPFVTQGGYDMFITVKPNDPNFVIIGGTSLYRSTDGFSTANYNTTLSWIGGYGNTLPTLTFHPNSHPDIHNLVFSPNPATPNEAICANDGGIQITNDITAGGSSVTWNHLMNYQTLQYYHITIDPESGANNFVGGSQDNGTQFRDKTGIVGVAAADSNNHRRLIGGDGGSVGISKSTGSAQFLYASVQFGSLRRGQLQPAFGSTDIKPTGLTPSFPGSTSEFGEFVTNFKLNPDNTEDLYYVNFNRLFRTTAASTVSSTGWTELTGVSSTVNATNGTDIVIRGMAFSRGQYASTHCLYFGTNHGRVYRIDNPRSSAASAIPVNISPPSTTNLNIQAIAVNPNNDNEIMVVISNYGVTSGNSLNNVVNIWWTNNAKSNTPTWKQAEGNLAGTTNSGYISARSCAIVVKKDASNNPVTEYYVGTAAGLFGVENLGTTLLANGSPTWQREGSTVLNYAVVSSLAYRPVDNVMAVGTHGNGLFYTMLGTPNLDTVINDPVITGKIFIKAVYPTIGSNLVEYKIGNQFEIKRIKVELFNMKGQQLYAAMRSYVDGSVNINRLPKGLYILRIYSEDGKYRHVQKLVR